MILEGIVTTLSETDEVNVAPMGPIVPESASAGIQQFILRPFKTSTTYSNLKHRGEGVLHVTDDSLLFAQAVLGKARPSTVLAHHIRGVRLEDCCRYYEFVIDEWDEIEDRTRLQARVVGTGRIRDFFGFNRAKHAVIEAAILASRVHFLPAEQLRAETAALKVMVEKTGSAQEHDAFTLLETFIADHTRENVS